MRFFSCFLRFRQCSLAVFLLLAGVPLGASTITYTSRSAFLAAAGATNTIDFSGIAPTNGSVSFSTPAGLTLDGVNFVGSGTFAGSTGNDLFVFDGAQSVWTLNGTAALVGALANGMSNPTPTIGELLITLPAGITALGMDIGSTSPGTVVYNATLSTGDTATGTATHVGAFLGFVSTTPITTLRFDTTNPAGGPERLVLDNVTMNQVPEPSSVLLFLAGLGALCVGRRRRS